MISLMLSTFENTVKFIEQSVSDLSEKEMIEQPMGVPNHATWTLGHVVHSCQGIANELGARAWLPNTWELTFGYGSTPEDGVAKVWEEVKRNGLVKEGRIGQAQCYLFKAQSFVGLYEKWLREDPLGLFGIKKNE